MKYRMRCPNCGKKQSRWIIKPWWVFDSTPYKQGICPYCNAILRIRSEATNSLIGVVVHILTFAAVIALLLTFPEVTNVPGIVIWTLIPVISLPAIALFWMMPYISELEYAQNVGDRACKKCHYNLKGVESDTCPECGTPHHANKK